MATGSRVQAALLMVLVTLLWSTAGVASRQLQVARSFEVTFWRALACAASLFLYLLWRPGGWATGPWRGRGASVWRVGVQFWGSAVCWAVMFTAFMVALTLTSVGNVLVSMAVGPLLTALFAWLALGHRVPARTWLAIVLAGLGIASMFDARLDAASLRGSLCALCVPVAGAINWTLTQSAQAHGKRIDLLPCVLLGALLSALVTLPLAWPLRANLHDLRILCALGVLQLALPCALCVRCARVLKAPEIALLQLLEVLFGIVLAWLGAGEVPTPAVLRGGVLVIGALLANEWLAWRQDR